MLKIKPNCEYCDTDLAANALNARICSYECTFCQQCVDEILKNVCPNCGGGFTPRPIRPKTAHRQGVCLLNHPPSGERVHTPYTKAEISAFAERLRSIPPAKR